MALQVTVNAVDVTANVLWEDSYFEEAADEGRVGGGVLVLRDLAGTFTPLFGHTVILNEGGTLRWRGIVAPDERGRDDAVDHVGPRRVVRLTLQDSNYLFDHASVDGSVRPVETDYARVVAAFAAERSAVDRVTFVPNASTVTMDARTYSDMMLRDEIADCAETADKDYWIDRDLKLHFVTPAQAAANVAPFALTDNPATYASDIFAGGATNFNVGLIRQRTDPFAIPLQTSLTLKYGPGSPPASVSATDNPLGITSPMEGPPVYDDRATTSTTAQARANALIRRMSTPEIGYDTTVALPNLSLKAGHYIAVTSSPLNLSAQSFKVATMTARRVGNKDAGYWNVDLALNAPRRFMPRARGFVQTSGHTGIGSPTVWTSGIFTPPDAFAIRHIWATDGSQTISYREWDLSAILGNAATWRWRVVNSSGYVSPNVSCVGTPLFVNTQIFRGTWTSLPSISDTTVAGVYVGNYQTFQTDQRVGIPTTNWTYPSASERKIKVFVKPSTTIGTHHPGCTLCTVGDSGCGLETEIDNVYLKGAHFEYQYYGTILPGQWIFGAEVIETPNGSIATFTTITPYVTGSLKVYVDGLEQPATTISPTAGTFSLLFAPLPGEVVTVDYLVGVGA